MAANLEGRALQLARDFRDRGHSLQDATKAIQAALNAAFNVGLSAAQIEALTHPNVRGNVEIIEKLEADCLSQKVFATDPSQVDKTHISLDELANSSQRHGHVIYADDLDKKEFFEATLKTTFLLNSSQHNAGYDFAGVIAYSLHDGDASVRICQQKVGKTAINNAKTPENKNRSAKLISDGLVAGASRLEARIEELYDVRAEVVSELHTTSPVGDTARTELRARHVELYDATRIWDEVWTDDVKRALTQIHGAQKAKGLGIVL